MNKPSIKSQVIILTTVSLILLASITIFLSSSKSKDALLKNSYDSLSMVRDLKKSGIEEFFHHALRDINVLEMSKNL